MYEGHSFINEDMHTGAFISLTQGENVAAHEFGHLMGLKDRYEEREKPDKKGETAFYPMEGWENNIMVKSEGRADKRNLTAIVNKAVEKYEAKKNTSSQNQNFKYIYKRTVNNREKR